jgi:hypothetical protein
MRYRSFIADVFAMIVFSTAVGMGVEVYISGMTFSQSLAARIASIIPNLLTARPYGVFRDWVLRLFGVTKGRWLRRGIADIVAITIFQVPLYAIILWFAGANRAQILTACSALSILSAFMGWPCGLFLDLCRKIFRVNSSIPRAST